MQKIDWVRMAKFFNRIQNYSWYKETSIENTFKEVEAGYSWTWVETAHL